MSRAERHSAILQELSELCMVAARDLQARVLAAETPEQAAVAANALHRMSRSVRQSLALEARLERDAKRDAREDLAEAERQTGVRVDRRKAQVRATVERLIWTEAEDHEAELLIDSLDDLLTEDALYDTFTNDPVEVHIAGLCKDLGLTPPAHPGEGRPSQFGSAPSEDDRWRSSA